MGLGEEELWKGRWWEEEDLRERVIRADARKRVMQRRVVLIVEVEVMVALFFFLAFTLP